MRLKRPFRLVLVWQCIATALIAMASGLLAGGESAWSAVMGGGIGVAGMLAFSLMAGRRSATTAGAVSVALRAEAVKIGVIVLLLWLAFAGQRDIAVLPFFGAFVVSVLLSGIALAVSGD